MVDVGTPPASVETTITDDDLPPGADPYPLIVAEDALNTLMGFGVTVGPRAAETVVEYRFGGTATGAVAINPEDAPPGTDYRHTSRNTLTFAAGPTETKPIQVAIVNDMIVEGDETIMVTLVLRDGYRFETLVPPTATGMIGDDDAVTATLAGPASGSVDEDAGTAEYTVTLGGSPSADVDVTWAVTDGGTDPAATDTVAADFGDGTATTLPTGTQDADTCPG